MLVFLVYIYKVGVMYMISKIEGDYGCSSVFMILVSCNDREAD